MKNSFLASLNQKFIFVITLGFLSTSVLFMVVFTRLYTAQLERERVQTQNKTDRMLEIYIQNIQLKNELKKIVEVSANEILRTKNFFSPYNNSGFLFYPYAKVLQEYKNENIKINNEILKIIASKSEQQDVAGFLIDSDVYESRYRAMLTAIRLVGAGAVLIILVMVGMYWLMTYYVINPIERLVFASEKLAMGDLDARVEIIGDKRRNDEMKRLSVAFNKMAENLQMGLKEIEKKEKFQQALIDAIPDGIRVIDDEFRIITSNKAYQKYAGEGDFVKNNVFCYQSSHKRTTPCSSALTTCPLAEIQKNPEPISAVQCFILPDGKEKYVEVRGAPIKLLNVNEDKFLIVESIRDLTSDIRFSHQQKLSSIGLLATSVAHEMRNPLGSIRLVIEGIIARIEKGDMTFDETINYLKMINEQLIVCIEVTERLLKMGRFPSDNLERIDCRNAIKETVSLLDYEAKKQGINVTTIIPEKPVYIMASESEIRIVIVNLVQNAFNAISKDGEITVSLEENDERILIKVVDNGRGIEKNKLSRIFEPFYTEKGTSNSKEGTGLGLTITKDIIEKFGGSIKVHSEILKGTSFEISFDKKNRA